MHKLLGGLAALVLLAATPAAAATFLTVAGPASDGSLSWDFGNTGGLAAGPFDDIFNILLPDNGATAGSVQATFTSGANNLTFTAVTFDGLGFTLFDLPGFHGGTLAPHLTPAGLRVLEVEGISPGIAGSYTGHLTFSPSERGPGVPEPATWALMLLGFGSMGATLRARRALRLAR